LLFALPLAVARRESLDFDMHAAAMANATKLKECGREAAEPGAPLQKYFDSLRKIYGIKGTSNFLGDDGLQDPAHCTKKDVCLLMRQLDMDFFQRARTGLLQDSDYQVPPTKGWVTKGNCDNQEGVRGFKMKPVIDEAVCSKAAAKKGATFVGYSDDGGPYGCFLRDDGKGALAYVNPDEKSAETAGTAKAKRSYLSMIEVKGRAVKTEILCEMDRSLTESGSVYYSPYKLKPGMIGREAMSTSCSYGMYAFLAKLRETKSPCAKILAYQTLAKFKSAQDALDLAAKLDREGKAKEAELLRAYVEAVRQKYVLIDVIANSWCPGIWTSAMSREGGSTCAAPRLPTWTAEAKKVEEAAKGGKKEAPCKQGGKLACKIEAKIKQWKKPDMAGNKGVLKDVDALLASLEAEDKVAENLASAKDSDSASPEQLDSSGKPVKIVLTEEACTNLEDQSLADLLKGRPQAPTDFFRGN